MSRWLRARSAEPHVERQSGYVPLFCALLPVCFYIGYFGAGAGFLIMTALALFGVEEMHALNCAEGSGSLSVELVRVWYVCLQRSGDLALLPDLDGVCRDWRLCRGAVCAADECGGAADDCGGDGMCDFGIFWTACIST